MFTEKGTKLREKGRELTCNKLVNSAVHFSQMQKKNVL